MWYVSEYIEWCWETGESINDAQDIISSLGHLLPKLKGKFLEAWSFVSAWHRQEPPAKAWPFAGAMVAALMGHALKADDPDFACMLVLDFQGLLRPWEFLKVRPKDCKFAKDGSSVANDLGYTKIGKR